MSLAEIESELGKLTPDELRHLALKSWNAFVEKESQQKGDHECCEDDPALLAALDEAIEKSDKASHRGYSGAEVRARLSQWTSR